MGRPVDPGAEVAPPPAASEAAAAPEPAPEVAEPAAPEPAPEVAEPAAPAGAAPAPPEAGPEPGEEGRGAHRRGRRLLLASGVAAVVVVTLAVALALTAVALRDRDAADQARTEALAAARSDAVALAAYDYRQLDADFAAVLAQATPAFARTYTQSSAALKSVLVKYKATATAKVIAAGVETSSADRATVLVFLDQTVTNSSQRSGPSTTQSRLLLSLLRTGGHWRIDQVKLL